MQTYQSVSISFFLVVVLIGLFPYALSFRPIQFLLTLIKETVHQEPFDETQASLQINAKKLLKDAHNGDEQALSVIYDSLSNAKHPLHGMYRVSSNKNLILKEEITSPAPLLASPVVDDQGDLIWKASKPGDLPKN